VVARQQAALAEELDLNQLAVLLTNKAQFSEAEPLYRRALAIDPASGRLWSGEDFPLLGIQLPCSRKDRHACC